MDHPRVPSFVRPRPPARSLAWFAWVVTCGWVLGSALAESGEFSLTLQRRVDTGDAPTEPRETRVVRTPARWKAAETAVIVCDMWDLHHCLNAVRRVREMAPRMDAFLRRARSEGALIIHAPSSCMKPYEDHPGRARAKAAPRAAQLPKDIGEWCSRIPAEEKGRYPIDQSDGGEDDDPQEHAAWAAHLKGLGLNPGAPWTRQTDLLTIQPEDAISDSGVEIWNLLEQRGIRQVLLLGVHVNMCVSGRPFGLRQMARNGRAVALVRDLTDSMYNPARWPHVDHFKGTALYVEHVEKFIAPTITSDQVLGGEPFRFTEPTPRTAF